jgi:hypothetical protein
MLENGKPTSIEKVESEASAEGTFEVLLKVKAV